MSKQGAVIILVVSIAFILGFSYVMGQLLLNVEKAAIETMETYCGPETAKRFELRSVDCE